MDGLECSEIRMSDVCDTTTLRFDSDYYKKEYLEIEQFICKNRDKFVTIESQGLQVDASAFYPSLEPYYNTGTIPFVRVADVKDQIEYNACVNIPEMGEEFRTLHMCYPGDVVLTKGGRVGTAGLITQPSYVTRDLIFINASALSRKDYIVLYLFFSSSFAYKQMVRSSSMTAQPHLTITLIRDLLVCNYSMLSGVLASSTSTTMILPRFLSLFWMEKFRKILPRKCRTPLLFAVNLSNYLNMQNRLLKWPLSREKMLRWYG